MGARWCVVGLGLAWVVGCGPPGPEVPTGGQQSVGALYLTVSLQSDGMSPTWARMREGGTLVFLNVDTQPRRVLFGVLPGEERCRAWSGPLLEPGRQYPLMVTQGLDGCTFHDEQAPEDGRFQGVVEVERRRGPVQRHR